MNHLKYPIGQFSLKEKVSPEKLESWIEDIKNLPLQLKQAIQGLDEAQLDTVYRPDGWTVRQVVHHVADSHINAYTRFRLALTEETPTIKPYEEQRWAELLDAKYSPVELSLGLLDHLHQRWVTLLQSLSSNDFQKTFYHPDSNEICLDQCVGLYAWHGKHHLAHITTLRERMSWN
ncbi:YfiT family bacillithiol transferase [Thermoflavimicrobium daqui]|uniref:Putative metal-dependent hydrolase DL897_10205 n=1 Tax=Thermoflavimicrobium daqui TaxID=2137476 RepID=A0A364K3X8_9BACL|nr:bacillithiol transferase BstA [Thermoflavimicrobium daqui]RAL24062.1 putative metal-dependent hydrolase [Thermoflavimicrobium daqui]